MLHGSWQLMILSAETSYASAMVLLIVITSKFGIMMYITVFYGAEIYLMLYGQLLESVYTHGRPHS